MYGVRQTVSLLLFGFGGILVLLGGVALFAEAPEGSSAEANWWVTSGFTIGGILGLVLIAWGMYLRSSSADGATWPLWLTYACLLGPVIALGVFVGDEVLQVTGERWQRSSPREIRGMVKGIFGLALIFFGPIILLFRRRTPKAVKDDTSKQ